MMGDENNQYIYIKRVTCPIYLDEIKKLDYLTHEIDKASIIWYDGIFRSDKYIDINKSKYLNKIPGMNEICYKYNLYKSLIRYSKNHKEFQKYIPETYLIPDDQYKFNNSYFPKTTTWIMKPGSGYGGKGIEIFQGSYCQFPEKAIVQKYISPYTIDGHKFDLRLHILIACVRPLSVYVCKEGIARFCSDKYEEPNSKNIQNKYQHLTNSCLNCKNSNSNGFKFIRHASEVLSQISENNKNLKLWNEITQLCRFVIKSLQIDIENQINNSCYGEEEDGEQIDKFKRFFHLLGIDILIGKDLKPYILELNDNPAIKNFNEEDEQIKRYTVKSEVQFITSKLLNLQNCDNDVLNDWEKII